MSRRTTFAGLLELAIGEPLETDGGAFVKSNIRTIDRYLEIGAVTHRHDAHEPIDGPVASAAIEVVPSGGAIPADVTMFVGYTLVDADGGETLLSPISASGTLLPADPPDYAPSGVIDYTGGALRADTYYYAITFLDGEGGETLAGPWVDVEREPGYASGQVQLSEMGNIAASAGMPAWALYRATGGEDYHYLASGGVADNTITDDGDLCADCSRRPPTTNLTNGSHSFIVTVPDSTELDAASAFRVYMTPDNEFTDPCLLGEYPIASAASGLTYRSLTVDEGSPPDVPTTVRGASLIDPDTELLDWHWKRPVDTVGDLPTVGTETGDVRIVTASNSPYVATGDGGPWQPLEALADVMIGEVAASGSGSVGPASAVVFVGAGGLTAEVESASGSAVVTLTAASGAGGAGGATDAQAWYDGTLSAPVASGAGFVNFEWTEGAEVGAATLLDMDTVGTPDAPAFIEAGVYTVDVSAWFDSANEDPDADIGIQASINPGVPYAVDGASMRDSVFGGNMSTSMTVVVDSGDRLLINIGHNSDTSLTTDAGAHLVLTKIG